MDFFDEENIPSSVFSETLEMMEKRHNKETRDMDGKIRALLKTAKKSTRLALDLQANQMSCSLKEKHINEINDLEEYLSNNGKILNLSDLKLVEEEEVVVIEVKQVPQTPNEIKEAKKLKAAKKREKEKLKEENRIKKKEEINQNSGPSLREEELTYINQLLKSKKLIVKEIISDGNCLYRAIADQLDNIDYIELRKMTSSYMIDNSNDFCPFLGFSNNDPEYLSYCNKVGSATMAEWGGQIEIRAISNCLNRKIQIYDAQAPILTMDSENGSDENIEPIVLTYHRHYYSLGEHYNSVSKIII